MKNYYQQKRGGWTLEPEIYAKTVGEIRCYPLFQNALREEAGAGAVSDVNVNMNMGAEASAVSDVNVSLDAEAGAVSDVHMDVPWDQVSPRQAASRYVRAIEQALEKYVPGSYREAVMAHLTEGVEYSKLEESRFISTATLKRYVQVFVWGVAEELGENLRRAAG